MEWGSQSPTDPWMRLGDPYQSSSFDGDLDGKYLFFSPSQIQLVRIIENEIAMHHFQVGKVIRKATGEDFVACLYWHNDSRKYELAQRYKNVPNLKYRWYKKNEDTRAGKYSQQFIKDRQK